MMPGIPTFISGNHSQQSLNSPSLSYPSSPKMAEKQHQQQKYHQHPYHNVGLCGCQRGSKSHCVSAFGVLILVLAYTAMGSMLFMTLEGDDELGKAVETPVAASKPRTDLVNADIRSRTVDRLWSITEDLNILYKENWTRLAAQEVQQFQDTLLRAVRASKIQPSGVQPSVKPHKWSYASAFLYSITLITTIGYGGISPRTQWGRIAALLYALFGIPIILLYLSAMGEALSSVMRFLFRKLRSCGRSKKNSGNSSGSSSSNTSTNSSTGSVVGIKMTASENGLMEKRSQNYNGNGGVTKSTVNYLGSGQRYNYNGNHYHQPHQHSPSVPISICVMILICYVTMGAVLFNRLQSWGVLESLYFCFTSLGTIGFGDLLPKGSIAQYAASAYILVGMAVVAMCFSLIQTELIMWLRRFGVQDTQQTHPSTSVPASYNHMMHSKHHNHMMHQLPQSTATEDVALVTVAVTPKS